LLMPASGSGAPVDPDFSSVTALYHFDETAGATTFVDMSGSANNLVATGTTVTSATQSKFGNGAYSPTGYAVNTAHAGMQMGSGNFTIEFWWYPTTLTGNSILMICDDGFFPGGGEHWFYHNGSGSLAYQGPSGGTFFSANGVLTVNTAHHIAYDRGASNLGRLYVNGAVVVGPTTDNQNYNTASQRLYIPGGIANIASSYHDELRITKGVARYQGAYTPAASPFPDS
jgi:hypothetical protein